MGSNNNTHTNINVNNNNNNHTNTYNDSNANSNNHQTNYNNSYITINNNDNKPLIIWIDYSIDNEKNRAYKTELQNLGTFKGFNSIQNGINEILKIKFKRLILILSKRMFNDFIILFDKEKNKIFCCLNILVFTVKSKKSLVEEIRNNNKEISSGYLFNKTNIFDNINDIINFIKTEKEGKKNNYKHFETIEKNNAMLFDEKIEKFEKTEYLEELIKIIEPLSLEEIHIFNYYLSNSFGKEGEEIKAIINQFNNIAEMPIEIMCKYWMRIYTLEKGKFYTILNNGLKEKKYKLFLLKEKYLIQL